MKLIVKIGLIALLLMFNYQGVDADVVSSAIDRYATTTEHQDNMASDHGTLEPCLSPTLYSQGNSRY